MEKAKSDGEAQPNQRIRLSIQSLSAVLMGYRRPAEMAQIGRLEGPANAIQALEKAVPKRETYFA